MHFETNIFSSNINFSPNLVCTQLSYQNRLYKIVSRYMYLFVYNINSSMFNYSDLYLLLFSFGIDAEMFLNVPAKKQKKLYYF